MRIILISLFLVLACYTDLRYRRVSNRSCFLMFVISVPFIVQLISVRYVITVGLIFLIIFFAFKKGCFGGGDAKSLILISLLFPDPVLIIWIMFISSVIVIVLFLLKRVGRDTQIPFMIPISVSFWVLVCC
ncbi:A24 family peptidase [Methanosarcina acetivorans]